MLPKPKQILKKIKMSIANLEIFYIKYTQNFLFISCFPCLFAKMNLEI